MGSDHQHDFIDDKLDKNCSIFRILFDNQKIESYVAAARALLSAYLIDCKELEIGGCIGQGSSGVVYKGLYKGQSVAVKVLKDTTTNRSESSLNIEGEFRREVLGLIYCAHKNVLKLYGVCLSPDYGICIVTKFMEGGSLLQYLQRRKILKIKEILKLAKDVAKGMEFLHSKGIVHMDLKTANVFLDEEGNAVIGDLGVARLVNEVEEGGGQEIGTYRWMAPELCGVEEPGKGGGSFSYKSDVYSYGILLWELGTCKMPYADYSPVQAAVGVVMHGLRPSFPSHNFFPPLRYLVQKCWAQDPVVRPHFSEILRMLNIISQQQDWSST